MPLSAKKNLAAVSDKMLFSFGGNAHGDSLFGLLSVSLNRLKDFLRDRIPLDEGEVKFGFCDLLVNICVEPTKGAPAGEESPWTARGGFFGKKFSSANEVFAAADSSLFLRRGRGLLRGGLFALHA